MALTVMSSAISEGGSIPTQYTCDGENMSPPVRWTGAPSGTQGFALVVHDPDAPNGDFTHWVVFDIPGEVDHFDEGAGPIQTALEGVNDFGNIGYGGPCPPQGHGAHHYVFDLYALDEWHTGLGEGATRQEVEARIQSHTLEKALFTGTYQRQQLEAA